VAKTTKKQDLTKLTGAEQVSVMKNLSQQAASWLLDVNGRSLRDDGNVPRQANGKYNARELLAWASKRLPEVKFSDEELEAVFTLADCLGEEITRTRFFAYIDDLDRRHGASGVASFWREITLYLHDEIEDSRNCCLKACQPKSEAEIQSEIRRKVEDEIRREAREAEESRLIDEFKSYTECVNCGRIRRARRWVHEPAPKGRVQLQSVCPECRQEARDIRDRREAAEKAAGRA